MNNPFCQETIAETRQVLWYSTSTCKIITDTEDFFKTSFGRIFGYAENSGLSVVPPLAVAPPLQKQIRNAFRRDLRPLAHFDAPQGVNTILMSDNLAADFKLIFFG
jgi:hypothetical protein